MTGELHFRFAEAFAASEVEQVRQEWYATQRAALATPPARPFLIVTPAGLPLRDRISDLLSSHDIPVTSRQALPDWPRTSTLLYARTPDDERLSVALAFERLWKAMSLVTCAERWDLRSADDHVRLSLLKRALNQALGTISVHVELPGVALRTSGSTAHLRAIHVPDAADVARESRILDSRSERGMRNQESGIRAGSGIRPGPL